MKSRRPENAAATNDPIVWFAMRAPYCKEIAAKQLLDRLKIENFVPMRYEVATTKAHRMERRLVPAIHNLIFVKTTKALIQEVKSQTTILQYHTSPQNGRNVPIIVPNAQMELFITITNNQDNNLIYLKPEEINLKKGTRIRILGGPFSGLEGTFIKLKGIRNRRIVISIDGIAAIAMAEIKPDLIEVIDKDDPIKPISHNDEFMDN